jgi:hypothetical protein
MRRSELVRENGVATVTEATQIGMAMDGTGRWDASPLSPRFLGLLTPLWRRRDRCGQLPSGWEPGVAPWLWGVASITSFCFANFVRAAKVGFVGSGFFYRGTEINK